MELSVAEPSDGESVTCTTTLASRSSIGLVNNMPDAALRTTERQFRDLLSRAAAEQPVSLRVFSLPELPRSEAGQLHVGTIP